MRPPNHRARASTISSQSSHGRGHSRNWSGSSMGSVSDIASPEERRRPQSLAMAQQTASRAGLTLDTYSPNVLSPEAYQSYFNHSPSGYSTPTSVVSATTSSPLVPSGVQSPTGVPTRNYSWGERQATGRRLSIPAPYHAYPPPPGYNPSAVQHMSPLPSSTASTYSQSGSGYASPASSVFSDVRQDTTASEVDIRRRTWHPGTYGGHSSRAPTSGLSYYRTPDAPQPVAASQPAAAQAIRLPGIDSFDNVRSHPLAPLRRASGPREVDEILHKNRVQGGQTNIADAVAPYTRDPWGSINHGLTKLDIAHPPQRLPTMQGDHSRHPATRPLTYPTSNLQVIHREPPPSGSSNEFIKAMARPTSEESVTTRKKKRHAWYNGPLPTQPEVEPDLPTIRTSPEGSTSSDGVPTPSTGCMHEYHPAIFHSHDYVEALPTVLNSEDSGKVNMHSIQYLLAVD